MNFTNIILKWALSVGGRRKSLSDCHIDTSPGPGEFDVDVSFPTLVRYINVEMVIDSPFIRLILCTCRLFDGFALSGADSGYRLHQIGVW